MSFRKVLIYLAVFLGLSAYFYYFEVVRPKQKAEAEKEQQRLFKVQAPDIIGITLTRDASSIALEKKDGKWRIISPVDAPADSFEADALAEALASLSAKKEVAEGGDLAPFGLNSPSLVIDFKAKEREGTLLVGSSSPLDDGKYAMKKGEKKVLLVEGLSLRPLDRDIYQLREKSLFTLKEKDVEKIGLRRAEKDFTLKREESGWVAPDNEGFKVSEDKVSEFLDHLLFARAASFLDDKEPEDLGLDSPDIVVELSSKDRSERVELEPKKGGDMFAVTSVRPGVVTVSKADVEKLPASLKELEDLTFLAFDEAGVERVALGFGKEKEYTFTREKDRWKSREGKTLEGWVVNAMFSRLKKMEYSDISDEKPAKAPALVVALSGEDQKDILTVEFYETETGRKVRCGEKTYAVKGPDARLLGEWLETTVKRAVGSAPGKSPEPGS